MKIGNLKFPPDPEEMEAVAQADYNRFCGNTIGKIEHAAKVIETQHAIVKYLEYMAQVLAEAGRASEKAMGDPAVKAIDKWVNILRQRAKELLKEAAPKRIEPPTIEPDNPKGKFIE
jgi:hypothetical protein